MTAPIIATHVEVLESTDQYVIAAWRRLMLLVWRDEACVAGVERSRRLFESWGRRQPGGAAVLIVVPNQRMGPPDERTRTAMERTATAPEGYFKGIATLLEAEGFIAASARAIMTRLHTRGSTGGAPNVFGSVAAAASWAAGVLNDSALTPSGLTDAIRISRAR